jgi:hypothetical protein
VDDQYNFAATLVKTVMKTLSMHYPGQALNIVTTGHSLGGGLAQYAAYSSDQIKEVYAFAPSPITGYHQCSDVTNKRNCAGKKIDHIYERGEILSYLRGPKRILYPLSLNDPNITEVRFDFDTGMSLKRLASSTIDQHRMRAFALNLQRAAAEKQ